MRTALLGTVFLLGACGGGGSSFRSQVCTEIGCSAALSVTVHDANGRLPPGAHTVTVTADGVTTTCSFTLPLATLQGGGAAGIACPGGLTITVLQPMVCTTFEDGGTTTGVCTPLPGKLDAHLAVGGKPKTVRITQTIDGALALDETLAPVYTGSRPNGPGCEPLCAQASATLTLKAP